MSNTIVKVSSTPNLGVYSHTETGFVVHDIYSVADAIKANGVLACDMTRGEWAWIAGEDLFVEVYKRGAVSLQLLASNLLSSKIGLTNARICRSTYYLINGVSTQGNLFLPGLLRTNVGCGTDIRLFGIVTNAQAGRGYSQGLLDDLVDNAVTDLAGAYVTTDIGKYSGAVIPDILKDNVMGLGGNSFAYGKSATIIGRAVIAIPLKSWDAFLSQWRAALPNIDKSEVQEKADFAISRFSSVFKDAMFKVPSVRVPVVLTSDGKAYIDTNLGRAHNHEPIHNGLGLLQFWNALLSPTLPDAAGWWLTNPHACTVGASHTMARETFMGLGEHMFNTTTASGNMSSGTMSCTYNLLGSIDGVELMKILGGLYPRVSTATNHTSSTMITKCFMGYHADQAVATQGGGESQFDYETRLSADLAKGYGADAFNFGHWSLAGQPAVLASILLDASVQNKTIGGAHAMNVASGNLCSLLRVGSGSVRGLWEGCDLVANPSTFLRNQYA